jgi:hypothetical protein
MLNAELDDIPPPSSAFLFSSNNGKKAVRGQRSFRLFLFPVLPFFHASYAALNRSLP